MNLELAINKILVHHYRASIEPIRNDVSVKGKKVDGDIHYLKIVGRVVMRQSIRTHLAHQISQQTISHCCLANVHITREVPSARRQGKCAIKRRRRMQRVSISNAQHKSTRIAAMKQISISVPNNNSEALLGKKKEDDNIIFKTKTPQDQKRGKTSCTSVMLLILIQPTQRPARKHNANLQPQKRKGG